MIQGPKILTSTIRNCMKNSIPIMTRKNLLSKIPVNTFHSPWIFRALICTNTSGNIAHVSDISGAPGPFGIDMRAFPSTNLETKSRRCHARARHIHNTPRTPSIDPPGIPLYEVAGVCKRCRARVKHIQSPQDPSNDVWCLTLLFLATIMRKNLDLVRNLYQNPDLGHIFPVRSRSGSHIFCVIQTAIASRCPCVHMCPSTSCAMRAQEISHAYMRVLSPNG